MLPKKFIIYFRLTAHPSSQHLREGKSFQAVLSHPGEEKWGEVETGLWASTSVLLAAPAMSPSVKWAIPSP